MMRKSGVMKCMSLNKACKACEVIKSMPDYLKGQEGANMKLSEGNEKSLLYQYERTGLTPEQINKLLEHIKGECWLCKHSKPYDVSHTRKLSICELGFPSRKEQNTSPIAMVRDKQCEQWELKEL